MRLQRLTALAALALAAVTCPASAADAAAAAKLVAPYLEADTVAVARVDLAAVDVDSAVDRFARAAGVDVQALADPRRVLLGNVAAFRKAGATEVYVVASLADLPDPGPFVLVPRAGANDDDLKRALAVLGSQVVEPIDGMMFAGGKAARERLRSLTPAARPNLEAALAAVPGAAVQVAVVPGDDQRRVAGEMLPPLPGQLGGGPAAPLVNAFRWAAVGVETKSKLGLKVVVQAADAGAAKTYQAAINRGLDWAGGQQEVTRVLPKFADMRAVLSPRVDGARLTLAVDDSTAGVASALATMAGKARSSAGRTKSMNNLKQIALAWHLTVDANKGSFPSTIKSKDGKPLLSWRVAILPYVEQDALYKQFHLDEPWDSEHNKALVEKMPEIFRSPAQKVGGGKTTYLAPTGMVGNANVGVLGVKIQKIVDGTSNTVMVLESADEAAVEWTKPDDLAVDATNPFKGLIGHYEQGFAAAFADGSVRFISRGVKPASLIAYFTRDGREVISE